MPPKELQPYYGLDRLHVVRKADQLLDDARSMAKACVADIDKGFSDFSDDECTECYTRAECGLHVYEDTLLEAAEHYEHAGLALLAERVRIIPQTCVAVAWRQFDDTNATTEI